MQNLQTEVFEGIQQEVSWFFGSTKNVSTKVRVNRAQLRIDIIDGIQSKVPTRVIHIKDELQQVIYHNTEC